MGKKLAPLIAVVAVSWLSWWSGWCFAADFHAVKAQPVSLPPISFFTLASHNLVVLGIIASGFVTYTIPTWLVMVATGFRLGAVCCLAHHIGVPVLQYLLPHSFELLGYYLIIYFVVTAGPGFTVDTWAGKPIPITRAQVAWCALAVVMIVGAAYVEWQGIARQGQERASTINRRAK